MAWVKLDDHFTENPKVRPLSDRTFRLYVAGLCHCGSHLTDGVVERRFVSALLERVTKPMVQELVDAGLWLEYGKGFAVKDYLKYNPSREQVLAEREAAAERKRKWKEKNAGKNGDRNGVANARTEQPPDPSRPEGSRDGESEEPSAVAPSPAPSGGDGSERMHEPEQVERNRNGLSAARGVLRSAS